MRAFIQAGDKIAPYVIHSMTMCGINSWPRGTGLGLSSAGNKYGWSKFLREGKGEGEG
ncbi:hypothetical protein AGR1B_pa0242 [Agrobacterium fabacearum S56]|nr:hypothetical protein AGR1B_pa0242 [Agrobacterium fabacearum S56]